MRHSRNLLDVFLVLACLLIFPEIAISKQTMSPINTIVVPQVAEIIDEIKNLPEEAFSRNANQRKKAMINKFNAVNKKIVGDELQDAADKLANDILTKMDGCLSGNPKNDWIIDCIAQKTLTDLIGTLVQYLENPVFTECDARDQFIPLLENALGNSITAFSLKKIQASEFANRIKLQAPIDFPLTDSQGIAYRTILPINSESSRRSGVVTGYLKPLEGNNPGVDLGPELGWRVGCMPGSDTCGFLGFLDEESSHEGLTINFSTGTSFFEPADELLESFLGQPFDIEPGCNVFYNVEDVNIPLGFEEEGTPPLPPLTDRDFLPPGLIDAAPLRHTIPIVLDADWAFYLRAPESVWRRQAVIIGNVNVIYDFIEPESSGKFDIRFEIIGQEAWRFGHGPTTSDSLELSEEINDPGYVMVTHPKNNELSYFYVGYDMAGGVGGVAGGLCGLEGIERDTGLPWDRTFGSDFEHQWNHAWGQQIPDDDSGYEFSTLYGRVVVAAHELGHMIGALHSRGSNDACAADTGGWSRICGGTIMKSGRAGGVSPDFRQPFFSRLNDDLIVSCVGRVASP